MPSFRNGDRVRWNWGSGAGEGMITQTYTTRVEREIKGGEVIRDATDDNPAHLIRQDDGDEVLKSQSELDAA